MAWNDERQPTLSTARLVLRPFTTADGPRVDALAGAREVASTTTQVPHPYPAGGGAWWIATHGPEWSAGQQVVYAMTLADGGEVVGAISLVVNADANSAVLGYWLGLPYWNHGYTSEAASAIVDFAFTVLGVNRVESTHMARNPASGRVMEKAGLSLEGVQRQAIRKWDAYEDVVMRAILRSDWEGRRS
jgi:ribosomal-protein-alanine N-acetyltransferase